MAENDFYPLFRLLIERTRVLVTVCDNAAEVLSEEFQDMITGPLSSVQDVLDQCPAVSPWDGSFHEADIMVEIFRHETQLQEIPVAVRVRHIPSDMAVESYTKPSSVDNERVARRALAERVRAKWDEEKSMRQVAGTGSRQPRDTDLR